MDTKSPRRERQTRGLPLASWLLGLPGAACLLAGLALLVIDLGPIHPVLADDGTAIVLIVSAIALLGTAAFPLAFRRLAAADIKASGRDQ